MVRDLVRSYKQLPMTLYQIQTKFRDEPRPRFGIVRTREFLMKDAYSLDADLAQLNQSYDAMYEAYCRIYDRCGLPYVIVEAESGPIGGDSSHEFMVPCSTGEDKVIHCSQCGYAANQERAEIGGHERSRRLDRRMPPPTSRSRPPTSGRSARSASSSRSTSRRRPSCWSTWPTASRRRRSVRGDHELNEAKLRRAVGASARGPGRRGCDREGDRRTDGFPGAGRHQDPAGDRPCGHGDGRRSSSGATPSTFT